MNFPALKHFCETTSIYPPSAIVYPGMKQKEELRLIQTCEPLYSLSNPMLSEMRQSYKDLEVAFMFIKNIKRPYLASMIGTFFAHFGFARRTMKEVYRKEPSLVAYMNNNFDSDDAIEYDTEILMTFVLDDQENIDAYKSSMKSVSEMLKKRYK